jgi:hypothetical protein
MFGHNANDQVNTAQHGSDSSASDSVPNLQPQTIAPTAASSAPVVDDSAISSYVVTDLPGTSGASGGQNDLPDLSGTPGAPPASALGAPSTPPVIDAPHSSAPDLPSSDSSDSDLAGSHAPVGPAHKAEDNTELLELKQSALHALSPLLGHLEQTPEEKFRTTMMMIQASDDHTMLQAAYDAANSITDEKARAQALLDVVNEINYFTQAGETPAN